MFFWTRAILCIAVVTLMAVQRLPPEARSSLELSPPSTADVLGTACRTHLELCAAAATRSLGAEGLPLQRARDALGAHPALLRRGHRHDLPVALLARSLT